MSTEINDIEKTVVVFNSKCGSGDIDKKHLQSLFGECWSFPVGILGINETNPDKLVDTNVIIWGGDGTNCGVAENFRKIGGAGWCLLMDGGTLGDTSKATGVGRNTFETPRHYIKRIGDMYINNNLEVKEFSPGTIINGGEKNFLWTAGLGIAEQVLGRVEIARSKKLIKFARLVHGLWGITNDLRNAEEIDVSLPND
jgi:hypothetical protein